MRSFLTHSNKYRIIVLCENTLLDTKRNSGNFKKSKQKRKNERVINYKKKLKVVKQKGLMSGLETFDFLTESG